VRAASLNFPDALMVRGLYQVKPALPFVPGAELAGVVRAVGAGVERPRVGESIIGFAGNGGFAQLCAVDAARTMPLPEGVGFAEGAAFGLTYGTALHALRDCGALRPEETLAVLGAGGGTGIAAVECGKADGRPRDRVRVERGEAGARPRARRRRDDRLCERGSSRAAGRDRRQARRGCRLRRGRRPVYRARPFARPAGVAASS
jgi:NADPH:quinone reductase-like Zn-dependent oxidoreductase